jgi:hypothetical protein
MIELAYADVNQHAVMVILMHASTTLIAMTHPYPFLNVTLHTLLRIFPWGRQRAVIGIATGVIGEDEVVEEKRNSKFPRGGAVGNYEGEKENEVGHENCIFCIYHIDYIWNIVWLANP